MSKNEETKHDKYVEEVEKFAVYVNTESKTIGIFATIEDMLKADKNFHLKKLKGLYKYHVQMVIK